MLLYNAVGDYRIIDEFWKTLRMPDEQKPLLNILISFPYLQGQVSQLFKRLTEAPRKIDNLFLDAGTFTINNKYGTTNPRIPSRFDEFSQYLKLYREHFSAIAAYDEDFDDPDLNMCLLTRLACKLGNTTEIQEYLLNRIVPTVHAPREEAVEEFKLLVDMGYRYIAIGSHPVIKEDQWKTMGSYMNVIKQRDGVEIKRHLFGQLSFKTLKSLRPESADSSGFAKSAAYYVMKYWEDYGGSTSKEPELQNVQLIEDTVKRPGKMQMIQRKHKDFLLRTFGYHPDDLISNPDKRQIVNLYAVCQMQAWFNRPVQNTIPPVQSP